MRAVQYFSDSYLQAVKDTSPTEIARFLDEFQRLQSNGARSKLISIKIPEDLLAAFKAKCALQGVPYQTEIKRLMKNSL